MTLAHYELMIYVIVRILHTQSTKPSHLNNGGPIFGEQFDRFEPYKISPKAMRSEIAMFDQTPQYEGTCHMFQQKVRRLQCCILDILLMIIR